jgi:hypothetical protein
MRVAALGAMREVVSRSPNELRRMGLRRVRLGSTAFDYVTWNG